MYRQMTQWRSLLDDYRSSPREHKLNRAVTISMSDETVGTGYMFFIIRWLPGARQPLTLGRPSTAARRGETRTSTSFRLFCPMVTIASQLPEPFNGAVRALLPDTRVVGIARGVPDALPEGASILVAAPIIVRGARAPAQPPAGWPFGLRWVQLGSSGIDFYPRWFFDGPPVTTARGTASQAIAEFVLAAILAHAKRLPEVWIHDAMDWQAFPLATVQGSTVGIFGFGSIGEALAQKALALGANVVAVRRRMSTPSSVPGVNFVSDIGELVQQSDHLVLAAPATESTRHIVNRALLKRAKPGLHIINVARGSLIDDDALLEALDQGLIGQASLDVTEPEPLPAGHWFYSHPRVRLSPHTSAIGSHNTDELAHKFVRNFEALRTGAPLEDVVDVQRGY
jgi:phosphoglycerate dehydrogenase-like enzyme